MDWGDFSRVKPKKPKDPDNEPLTFGKLQGHTPLEIFDSEPSYLVGLYENAGTHLLSRALYEEAMDEADERDVRD